MRGTLITAIVALGVGIFAGCGSGSDTRPAAAMSPMGNLAMGTSAAPQAGASAADQASEQATSAAVIHISRFSFRPPASVAAGSTVSVMNMDAEAHTVTADTGDAFDVTAPPGTMTTFTAPSKPGTYKFHCNFHSNMQSVLVVK